MVCLGPRKKEKKPNATPTPAKPRNVKSATMPAFSAASTPKRPPRSSLDRSRATAATATTGRRAASPARRPMSPSQRSSAAAAATRLTHSRNSSNGSTRKSPVAQLREDFDVLKAKNEENEQVIADLKLQLAQAAPAATLRDADDLGPTPPMSQSTTHSDLSVLQLTEEKLKQREEEVDALRRQLEKMPSITAQSEDEIAERERLLAERERVLEEQQKSQSSLALDQVTRRLAEQEEELQHLRSQTATSTQEDSAALQKIEDLHRQLELQKHEHEESLRAHEVALAEKDKLLEEHKKAFQVLQQSHQDEMRGLETAQTRHILKLRAEHKKDVDEIKGKLDKAEQRKEIDPATDLDNEIERLLHEFEQAEHNHTVEIQQLESSHKDELSDLKGTHVSQLENLRKTQDEKVKTWTSRFLPTDAVSWPKPLPLSALRKTSSPQPRKPSLSTTNTYAPILTPLDCKLVQVYISTVSGSAMVRKNQEHIQQLLEMNRVRFELVDVAASEAALQHMKRCNNNGASTGRAKEVPQLFVGGEYRGQYQDVVQCIEDAKLDTLLVPAAERVLTEEEKTAIQKAEFAASMAANDPAHAPPVRVLPPGPVKLPTLRKTNSHHAPATIASTNSTSRLTAEDDALFKEIEMELASGRLVDTNLEDL